MEGEGSWIFSELLASGMSAATSGRRAAAMAAARTMTGGRRAAVRARHQQH